MNYHINNFLFLYAFARARVCADDPYRLCKHISVRSFVTCRRLLYRNRETFMLEMESVQNRVRTLVLRSENWLRLYLKSNQAKSGMKESAGVDSRRRPQPRAMCMAHSMYPYGYASCVAREMPATMLMSAKKAELLFVSTPVQ